MNQVDPEVGKEEEERDLDPIIPGTWAFGGEIVKF